MCDIVGDKDSCNRLVQSIQNALHELNRPKNLLIFVNPISGKKNAMKLYINNVAPILKLSGIKSDVREMKTQGLPKEFLATYDLSTIQGIVAVGGDGTFSECVNGLLARIQSDHHVDINDSSTQIVASKIPLGIVPAGSGNYLVNYMHGTTDVETAVLKIVLGGHMMMNVVGLYQSKKLTCFASLLLEFGLVGNMMRDCEKFRGLGQSRFNYWEKIDGRVYSIDTYVVTQEEKQGNLVPRFCDHALTMWMTAKCSIKKHVKHLRKLQNSLAGFLDYDFIRKIRTTCYRVKLNYTPTLKGADENQHNKKKFYVNVDGEAIHLSAQMFEVKLHRCAIPVLGKFVE